MPDAPRFLAAEQATAILERLTGLEEWRVLILVGGQAIGLWARLYKPALNDAGLVAPSTTDIDFLGRRAWVTTIAEQLDGTALLPELFDPTPAAGIVLFTDPAGCRRQLDVLHHVYGMKPDDLVSTAQHVRLGSGARGVLVMHPQRCMESRLHNTIGLGRRDPRSLHQARVAIACAREFSRRLIDHADPDPAHVRAVLALNQRCYRFATSRVGRAAWHDHQLNALDGALLDHPNLPAKVLTHTVPRWRAHLAERYPPGT